MENDTNNIIKIEEFYQKKIKRLNKLTSKLTMDYLDLECRNKRKYYILKHIDDLGIYCYPSLKIILREEERFIRDI